MEFLDMHLVLILLILSQQFESVHLRVLAGSHV